ncbi:DUF5810 domain-containing protein [Halobacterium salinarum]|uniref:DUF5810 domain-containing protein n=1 Tax=Halobacterium salinarum TaxID=2242 RepID=UPI003904A756
MGYLCPVCGVETADGEHLANHVAFTALTRGGDHEAWLDEHAPAWADSGPAELADTVVGHATETDAEPVSEAHTHDAPAGARASVDASAADSDDVLAEARELTAAMYASSADDNGDSENE